MLVQTLDVAARYGGEEFVVILPNAPLNGAIVVAEHIRATVQRLDLSDAGQEKRKVTISIGVATVMPMQVNGFARLIPAADAALYQAKHEGRNRVIAIDLDARNQAPQS